MIALTDPAATLCSVLIMGFAFGLIAIGNRR